MPSIVDRLSLIFPWGFPFTVCWLAGREVRMSFRNFAQQPLICNYPQTLHPFGKSVTLTSNVLNKGIHTQIFKWKIQAIIHWTSLMSPWFMNTISWMHEKIASCTWQNSFTMKPKASTCLQVQLLDRQRKKCRWFNGSNILLTASRF